MADLTQRSVDLILEHQARSGAYPACPTYPPYRFCWLRDGSFVADAMSRWGELASAEAFFDFVAGLDHFDARYTLAGERDGGEWPLVQHDGWGLWLWVLRAHCLRHGVANRWAAAAERIERHLERVRLQPCTDWWEERDGIHAATLACIAAGLGDDDLDLTPAADRLDASLLVLPFLGFELPRPVDELVSPGGGVHRHLEDTYYGGGEWLLLTALLGLAVDTRAADCLEWLAAHASPDGHLPEQSQDHLLAADLYQPWVDTWGPPASPLLWSHAMYLTLASSLR